MAANPDVASSETTTSADNAALKRKREDTTSTSTSATRIKQIQPDLLQVLESHDTSPSFLKHSLPHSTSTANSEPSHKKARLSEPQSDGDGLSIAAKLSNASYTSLQQLKADASRVSENLISSIRTKDKEKEKEKDGGVRPSVEDLKLIRRIQHFEAMLNDFVVAEEQHLNLPAETVTKEEHSPEEETDTKAANGKVGTVLTLFGNAPTPKQLFSSVQNPLLDRKDSFVKVELPVDEMNLPNGITATKIVPVNANEGRKGPTFQETFAPPYNLAPLNPPAVTPPKVPKKTLTRDNIIEWKFKDPISRRDKKGCYTVQALTVGNWLGYGGVDDSEGSSREKRKQRDRALSGGDKLEPAPTQAQLDDALAKEEAALFRRAYSSYTPSCDNSNAVLPDVVKNAVWWSKVGHQRFDNTFALDPALRDEAPPPEVAQLNDEELGQVVASLDELESETIEEDMPLAPVKSKTDVEDVLRQISELLETLASHQRIRNASLAPSIPIARAPMSPGVAALKPGKPDEPSEDEITTYDNLRREIAYLVLKLPPYAVAKLDGDQMSDLGVSTLITFQSKDIRGSLEEDLVTRQAKAAASQTAQSLANLTNRPNSSAGQHYSTTAQRTPAIGQAANTRYGQQYPGRPSVPTPQFSRSTSNQQSYGTPASVPRPSYGGANTYTRPGASQTSTFGQSNGQGYYPGQQRTTSYGNALNQFQQQQQNNRPPPSFPPSQANFPPRTSSTYPASTTNNNQFPRTVSPAQGGYSSPMLPAQQQLAAALNRQNQNLYPGQQQSGTGSGRGTPVNGYPSQPNTPVNGFTQRSVAPRPMSGTPQLQGTSDENSMMKMIVREDGREVCAYCEQELGERETVGSHRCRDLRCRKCGKGYVYSGVFRRHVEGCGGPGA